MAETSGDGDKGSGTLAESDGDGDKGRVTLAKTSGDGDKGSLFITGYLSCHCCPYGVAQN